MFFLLIIDRVFLTRQFEYAREIQRMNHVGSLLTSFIGDNLADHDTNDVKRIIANSLEQPDIELVSVMDDHNMIRYSSNKKLEMKPTPFPDSKKNDRSDDIFYKTFAINYKNIDLGFLQIGYSLHSIRRNLNMSFYRVLIFEAVFFFAVLFIAWSITGKLLKPLYEMKEVSNKIAGGDFAIRAHPTSHDIIGELAEALNDMALQLGDLTENMKIRVQEATSELLFSNMKLLKQTEELEKSNRKLQELDKLKSDFVSMVSHELRTPLTSIIGFSKTIRTLDLPPDKRKNYLEIIESEGKRLSGLIEEYLDISKIESGKFSLRLKPTDVAHLIEQIIQSQPMDPGIELETTIPSSLPYVYCDAEHIKRVIINLVDNAKKYSPPGKKISITAEEYKNRVVIRIIDEGPGINEGEKDKIFDKFFRGSDPVSKKSRGSGLGLAIAKGIIKAHGGEIWVDTSSEKGSIFSFSVPILNGEVTQIAQKEDQA
jgi:signal transduction histidine kinase